MEDVHQQDSINSCTQAIAIGYDIPHLLNLNMTNCYTATNNFYADQLGQSSS